MKNSLYVIFFRSPYHFFPVFKYSPHRPKVITETVFIQLVPFCHYGNLKKKQPLLVREICLKVTYPYFSLKLKDFIKHLTN